MLYVQFATLQVHEELLLFVCLKSLIMSQGSAMLEDVTNRSKRLTLKNLCAKQSGVGRIHWKEMIKLFRSAVRLLNSQSVEYSSFIIFFPPMGFLSSHPTKDFGVLGGVLGF